VWYDRLGVDPRRAGLHHVDAFSRWRSDIATTPRLLQLEAEVWGVDPSPHRDRLIAERLTAMTQQAGLATVTSLRPLENGQGRAGGRS
jgi:hypothetical protein